MAAAAIKKAVVPYHAIKPKGHAFAYTRQKVSNYALNIVSLVELCTSITRTRE